MAPEPSPVKKEFAFPRIAFLTIIALVPLIRFIGDVSRGFDDLMYRFLVDDAFYYFEISRHIPEFNNGVPTSGFHPLYAFLIAPFHNWLDYHYAIPVSLLILVVALVLGVFTIHHLVSHFWSEPIPLLCAFGWATNGKLYSIAMSGVEMMLAVFLVSMFLVFFISYVAGCTGGRPARDYACLGLLASFAFLARMDAPLIILPFLAYVAFRLLQQRSWSRLVLLSLPALALPLIWLLYVKCATGEFFPTSGAALRVLRGIDHLLIAPPSRIYTSVAALLGNAMSFLLPVSISLTARALSAALVVAAVIASLAAAYRASPQRTRNLFDYLLLLSSGIFLWSLYYILYQGGFRSWYHGYIGIVIISIVLPLLLAFVFRVISSAKTALTFSTLLVILFALLSQPGPRGPQAYDKYQAALTANPILKAKMRRSPGAVGAFNTGIYDYFTTFDVINLDGVVNPQSLQAIRDDQLATYLRQKNIKYLIEHEVAANLDLLRDDDSVRLIKWIDLTRLYEQSDGFTTKRTFLWRLKFRDLQSIEESSDLERYIP